MRIGIYRRRQRAARGAANGRGHHHGGGGAGALDGISAITGAYSASRRLLAAYGSGSFYTLDGSNHVTTFFDQSGSSHDFTSSGACTVSAQGTNSRNAVNGGIGNLLAGAAISNFFSNSDGYVCVSCLPTTFATNSGNSYANHCVIGDTTQGYMGIYLKNNNTMMAYNFDTTDDHADNTITTATPYVFEWWHTGGNVVGRVNVSGSGVSTASGNTGVMTGGLDLFIGAPSSQAFVGAIWEVVVRSTAGTSGERDAIAGALKSWAGA